MKKILMGMITCDSRKQIFEETINDLKKTDWPHEPFVRVDPLNHPNKQLSSTCNTLGLLQTFLLKGDYEWLLFTEDDIIFNKHIWHNLQTWPALDKHLILNLFCGLPIGRFAGFGSGDVCYGSRYFACAQAVLLNRSIIPTLINDWSFHEVFGYDLRMRNIMNDNNFVICAHFPTLVQHRDLPSTLGNRTGTVSSFDEFWKREAIIAL